MASPDMAARPESEFPFLCVDAFLADAVGARALASALEVVLIDTLAASDRVAGDALAAELGLQPRGLALLVALLLAGGVLAARGGAIGLSERFRAALAYRDLLQVRLDFAAAVLPDFHRLFTILLSRPQEFIGRARIFDLFRYDRCSEATPENVARARRWMRLTTVLSKYESRACLARRRFDRYRRMLDVGGNSGEFARRLCQANPALRASVLDLPVVCAIGREHLAGTPESARITFVDGDVRRDPLPGGHDLISFKSFLHDWPPADALALIDRAAGALAPGGTLLVFERGPIAIGTAPPSCTVIAYLPFLYYLRSPESYVAQMTASGLTDIEVTRIDLEMPFHLVTARKPG